MLNDVTRWLLPWGSDNWFPWCYTVPGLMAPYWHARLQLSIPTLQLPLQKVFQSPHFPGITLSHSSLVTKRHTVQEFMFSYEGTWKVTNRALCMGGGVARCRNSSYRIHPYVLYHVFPYWYLLSHIYHIPFLVNYLISTIYTHTLKLQ